MNTNSLICKYIAEHENWREDFTDKSIYFKENDEGLCIFKYFINADFYDSLVCEARGIIIDLNSLDVVCIGFNKFFNQHEPYAAEINWENCRIQDKKDGSIIKLWYHNGKWNWATNGVIYAKDANIEDFTHTNFMDLIEDAVNFKDINYSVLNKDFTYIFEIVDPILHPVKYPEIKLYHLGTRNNKTLEEVIVDIGIDKPEEYDLHSLKEVIDFVSVMNQDEVTQEGVVVVDNNWNRIKIKNMTYLQLHYLNSGIITNKVKILEILHTDDVDITTLIKRFPQYTDVFNYYKTEEFKLKESLQSFIEWVRTMYTKSNKDRKQIAMLIKDHKFNYFGFKALDTILTAEDMINEVRTKNINNYAKLIDDYRR